MGDLAKAAVRFEVLGRLRGWRESTALSFGVRQQRVVMAVFLLRANRPLGKEQLIEAVWGPNAPAYAVNLIQKHVSALRQVLEPSRPGRAASGPLRWTDAGYLLRVPDGALDLAVFEREAARGRAARATGDLRAAAAALHGAVAQWRGSVCDGLASPLLDAERGRLDERRVNVIEERCEVDLALGNHVDLVSELRQLVGEHPLRERLRGLLMLALYRSGRQAEALGAYHDARRHLRDELGVEPTPQLAQLHQRILTADPGLSTPVHVGEPISAPSVFAPAGTLAAGVEKAEAIGIENAADIDVVPAQLPHTTGAFTGRLEELERLHAVSSGEVTAGAVPVVVIMGTAGIGKTSLAVHWAHQARGEFPDGQLYINLRGFDPSGTRVEPGEAIRGFLDALGVPPHRVPASLETQAALYRSLLDGRRVLVVLDNAGGADQVRPLLPGSAGCRVLVTSRNELTGLAAAGAQVLPVGLLTAGEARELLVRRLGGQRVVAEPEAVERIIAACAGLPLALMIVAARAAVRPRFPLARLADQLEAPAGALDALGDGDEPTDVRAVISWSYRALSPQHARLLRLLGLCPGPDVTAGAAASLMAGGEREAASALAALAREHLVEERSPGRFGFHDLLRAYAAERARAEDSDAERQAALQRLLYHYLDTALAADRLLNPSREPLTAVAAPPGAAGVRLRGVDHARAWFAAERESLLAAVDHASHLSLDLPTWQLVWGLETFLDRRGQWRNRRYDGVQNRYGQALRRFELLGDRAGQAQVHAHLAWVLERQGRYRQAIEHAEQARRLFEVVRHRAGLADALNAVGWCHAQLGEHERAIECCEKALASHEEIGHRDGAAHTWDSLGYAHHALGRYATAVDCYRKAVELWRELGVRAYEAETLTRLAGSQLALGDAGAARASFASALVMLDEFGHPDAAAVRSKLESVSRMCCGEADGHH